MNIVLASGSPRRYELLTQAQVDFQVMSVDIDETLIAHETPTDYIQRMVQSKALAAIAQLNREIHTQYDVNTNNFESLVTPDTATIITADTIGVLPDAKTILVKPIDYQHACEMWQQMSNKTHQVWTAVNVVKIQLLPSSKDQRQWQCVDQQQIIEQTEVTFVPLTQAMMQEYWESGEPKDKAGGYGIQGRAAAWVTCINGSYTNVVGLPVAQTLALLKTLHKSL